MREIKFRAWHPTNKIMVHFDGESFGDPFVADHFGQLVSNRHPEGENLLMQYTGLKDKNGVEIYEGDILELKWLREKVYRGVIEFHDGRFVLYHDSGLTVISMTYQDCSLVIGNIHQNPELLGETK